MSTERGTHYDRGVLSFEELRTAFGDQVVDHYLNYARAEPALFDKVVTDWERIRLLERG